MNNTNTPTAEVKVQVRRIGGTWTDSLEFDPVRVPVEAYADGSSAALTDAFDSTVIGLVSAIIEADVTTDTQVLEYNIVWSDNGFSVKATCPVCDDVFPIAEGAPGDELNEGYNAVFCGCDPGDSMD